MCCNLTFLIQFLHAFLSAANYFLSPPRSFIFSSQISFGLQLLLLPVLLVLIISLTNALCYILITCQYQLSCCFSIFFASGFTNCLICSFSSLSHFVFLVIFLRYFICAAIIFPPASFILHKIQIHTSSPAIPLPLLFYLLIIYYHCISLVNI